MVIMERPQHGANSEQEIVGYYAKTLERVIGREKDAQKCIYHTSCDTHLGFCCEIDEQAAKELACLPDVIVVKPDHDYNSTEKDYSYSNGHSNLEVESNLLFPMGSTKHWLVRMDRPGVGVVTKAQMVDFYAQILTKVLGNEQDAQMCIYHISWQSTFGFCCELDEQCARELAGVPGVLSVVPDENFGSENKNYGGNSTSQLNFSEKGLTVPINPRKLFVTGLSFYTSEKTLCSAFEGFGELVEVKVIMDKISKRSKGYAFIEYTSEEAASVALKEMNGKIINGWMIVVDYAKDSPRNSRTRHNRGRPR